MMDEQKDINSVAVEKTILTSKSNRIARNHAREMEQLENLLLALEFDEDERALQFEDQWGDQWF